MHLIIKKVDEKSFNFLILEKNLIIDLISNFLNLMFMIIGNLQYSNSLCLVFCDSLANILVSLLLTYAILPVRNLC